MMDVNGKDNVGRVRKLQDEAFEMSRIKEKGRQAVFEVQRGAHPTLEHYEMALIRDNPGNPVRLTNRAHVLQVPENTLSCAPPHETEIYVSCLWTNSSRGRPLEAFGKTGLDGEREWLDNTWLAEGNNRVSTFKE